MTLDTIGVIWLLGALVGSMLFFAVTVAPTVFRSLPEQEAGLFLRAFFPQYYLWGAILSVICALVAIGHSLLISITCGLIAVLFIYARQVLMPQINLARDSDKQGVIGAANHFKKLHLRSVLINGLQLLTLVTASVFVAVQ
ncbi:MAG: DUF4149 domain-containing protein [Gammaproteobacteria bacterium]|nr:DUF4149 domain-containing protein [Gammaproteobacteria bacterium]